MPRSSLLNYALFASLIACVVLIALNPRERGRADVASRTAHAAFTARADAPFVLDRHIEEISDYLGASDRRLATALAHLDDVDGFDLPAFEDIGAYSAYSDFDVFLVADMGPGPPHGFGPRD